MSQTHIVVGLGWGDEAKGATVDYLTRQHNSQLTVRANGGSQAGHTVVTPSGVRHIFSQFGAGSFAGSDTFLSRYMLLNPMNLLLESGSLSTKGISNPLDHMFISENCLVVSPFAIAANRLREWSRQNERHGSCGQGIGEAVGDSLQYWEHALRVRDFAYPSTAAEKLRFIQQKKCGELLDALPKTLPDWMERERRLLLNEKLPERIAQDYNHFINLVNIVPDCFLESRLATGENIVFEGAQGALLHQDYGFQPHTTWSDTSFWNPEHLLIETGRWRVAKRIGCLRAYATRHGAGPFVSESADLNSLPPDPTNTFGPWQGAFRRGAFDAVMARYALGLTGDVDEIHLSCLDHLADRPRMAIQSYRDADGQPYVPDQNEPDRTAKMFQARISEWHSFGTDEQFIRHLEETLYASKITVLGYGPAAEDRRLNPHHQDRRVMTTRTLN